MIFQVTLVAARVWLQLEEDGATECTAVAKEGSGGIERETTVGCVQFVASHDQDSWQRKIATSCDVDRL
ncbi:hypothetical protein GW17_00060921 [Ensete ventricosum]|nr:hypothetical protein GW17_00060921 [Ensete ventricosum]